MGLLLLLLLRAVWGRLPRVWLGPDVGLRQCVAQDAMQREVLLLLVLRVLLLVRQRRLVWLLVCLLLRHGGDANARGRIELRSDVHHAQWVGAGSGHSRHLGDVGHGHSSSWVDVLSEWQRRSTGGLLIVVPGLALVLLVLLQPCC